MTLKVFVTPGQDGGFVAQVPALRGCWTHGSTREEVLANAREAIAAWLEVEQSKADHGAKIGDVELPSHRLTRGAMARHLPVITGRDARRAFDWLGGK